MVGRCLAATFLLPSSASVATGADGLLTPILRETTADEVEEYSTFSRDDSGTPATIAFHAVTAREWPTGLVPVYAFERRGVYQLGRLPPRGRENFIEPLFFALAPGHDTNATRIAGRWRVVATHREGSVSELGWELAVEGEKLAGRFDQNTDYRFAYVTEGVWRTNRIELKVDYINDRFEIGGGVTNGLAGGSWRRTDDGDSGSWTARRPPDNESATVPSLVGVPLFEWTHAESGRRRYRLEHETLPAPWSRSMLPLCLVWNPTDRHCLEHSSACQ
ncbi:MAG TPA: hypothetical protein DCY13_20600 [Verrucomicrobiales bacterium]|nr:hypothetical protein [Verrucomicrobiales bacterium]